jgi:phosphoribosyl 1,2-cyclic phosphate phosphodiesterase
VSQDAIDIYSEERVQNVIRKEYSYVFSEFRYPGVPKMRLNPIPEGGFSIKGIQIVPIRVFHYRLAVYGFRVGNFAYITDANFIPEESKERLSGVKYMVLNALRKEKHLSHFCLQEAIDFIGEISPEKAFITHISHQMGLYSEVARELPPGIVLAYDGLNFLCDD